MPNTDPSDHIIVIVVGIHQRMSHIEYLSSQPYGFQQFSMQFKQSLSRVSAKSKSNPGGDLLDDATHQISQLLVLRFLTRGVLSFPYNSTDPHLATYIILTLGPQFEEYCRGFLKTAYTHNKHLSSMPYGDERFYNRASIRG